MAGNKKAFTAVMRNYLVAYRMKLNLTQYEVARRAGFLQSEYNLIENGYKGHRMDSRRIIRLANALDVSIEDFVKAEAEYLDLFDAKNGREKRWY